MDNVLQDKHTYEKHNHSHSKEKKKTCFHFFRNNNRNKTYVLSQVKVHRHGD